jgi:flap endonuclease-1
MGIRGLAGYLRWRTPHARRPVQWTEHAGKRWAVDASCILYRARAASLSVLTVVAGLIVRLRRAGIEPVFVFDGNTPAAKTETIEKRREAREAVKQEIATIKAELAETAATESSGASSVTVAKEARVAELQARIPQITSRDRTDIKKFLYSAGVLFVTATGEADDLLGFLARTNQVGAVISTDMDMLARGVRVLVQPETPDTTVLTELSLVGVLGGLGLTYEQFVDACMLMGSDYTPREIRTMPPPVAVEAVRRGDVTVLEDERMKRGAALLRGEGVTWEGVLVDAQREKWMTGAPAIELEPLMARCAENMWPMEWRRALSKEDTSV